MAALILSATSAHALDPGPKCEASKNKTAGAYYSCRAKAESTAITKATMPDYSKCTAKFDDKWDGAETKGEGACPDNVAMTADMNAFIAAQAAEAALVVAGAPIPDCAGDLAACEAAPVCGDGFIGAGEECDVGNLSGATCATQGFAGGTLACATGCTFDESDCYATRIDASGDTIIDNETGLEWEKKDSLGGGANFANPHDVDNYYQWSSTGTAPDGGAFTDFLAKLNGGTSSGGPTTGCYAGRCDWRLPTLEELQGVPWLNAAFLPDAFSYYWSASTFALNPAFAWGVYTGGGNAFGNFGKTDDLFVRAVRSGS